MEVDRQVDFRGLDLKKENVIAVSGED